VRRWVKDTDEDTGKDTDEGADDGHALNII